MAFLETLEKVGRAVTRETLGAVVRAKAARADNQERIAALINLRARTTESMQPEHFVEAGKAWGIDPAVLHALADVEGGPSGFDQRGRLTILVEPHLFSALTNHAFDRSHPHLSYPKWVPFRKGDAPPAGFPAHPYTYGADDRWGLFSMQAELDVDAALGAMSAGRFQQVIGSPRPDMGWKVLRYASPEALYRKLAVSEIDQLEVLQTFIVGHGLKQSLRDRNWQAIAAAYNGPGQVAVYSAKMADAWKRRQRIYV